MSKRIGILNLSSLAVILLVLAFIGGSTLANDQPTTSQASDSSPIAGTVSPPTPVWPTEEPEFDTTTIKQLPTTGSGATAKEVRSLNHAGSWHYISSYCYNGYYHNLYKYAYYYDGWSHLWSQSYQQNTWYRCV